MISACFIVFSGDQDFAPAAVYSVGCTQAALRVLLAVTWLTVYRQLPLGTLHAAHGEKGRSPLLHGKWALYIC